MICKELWRKNNAIKNGAKHCTNEVKVSKNNKMKDDIFTKKKKNNFILK